jgi:hypothetical protein
MVASVVEPIFNFSAADPFADGDEQTEGDQNSEKDKKGNCDRSHGILLLFNRS